MRRSRGTRAERGPATGAASTAISAGWAFSRESQGSSHFPGRERDQAVAVKQEHESPADHVPGRPVGLRPVPPTAEFPGEQQPAGTGVSGDGFPDVFYVPFSVDPAPVPYSASHDALMYHRPGY